MSYFWSILGLALLMIVHESGHFLAARAFGLRVTRFSIGFGPTLAKVTPKDGYFWLTLLADRFKIRLFKHDPKRHGETIYQVAIIPFLAYVQIAGMNPLEDIDEEDRSSYANASLVARVVTIFSGPLANYLFASVFFFVSLFFGGMQDPTSTQVEVIEDQPAIHADMRTGDQLLTIAGEHVSDWHDVSTVIKKHPAESIPFVVRRDGAEVTLHVTPANDSGRGMIGVLPMKHPLPAAQSLKLALTDPPLVVRDVAVGLAETITGKQKPEFMGPIGMVKETAKAAHQSWTDLAKLLGIISAYLGAFNLIPFPALDGGRLMFLGYEATTRRRANARIEAHIHAIGLVMMISLMLYITVAKDLGFGLK
ncbi:MAG TPA: M50 family metallopeptidase [Byssovorax sp.]|jgi:regulator of sigma E protease